MGGLGLEEGQVEQLVYLVGALLLVSLLALPLRRIGLGRLAGYAAAWAAIFTLGAWALGESDDARRYVERAQLPEPAQVETLSGPTGGEIRVPASLDGHFWVRATVNGQPVRFLVDTGASDVVLSQRTARRVGIDVSRLRFDRAGMAANGPVRAASVRVERLVVGPIARRNIRVSVLDGAVDIDLLGMSFLRSLEGWRVEKDTLILTA